MIPPKIRLGQHYNKPLDRIYCDNPNCVNACGRKLTDDVRSEFRKPIWTSNFCGEQINEKYKPLKNHLPNVTKMV